jgi:hypothetical protein
VQACAGKDLVVAIQDTTSFNFSGLKATKGLGPIGDSKAAAQGIWCHTTLAVETSGTPLGVLHQELWVRDPAERHHARDRKLLPIEEKESFKWLQGIRAVHTALNAHLSASHRPRLLHVEDREGDIHEVFQEAHAHGDGAVIRACHNRVTDDPLKWAYAVVRASAPLGTVVLTIPRHEGHPERQARVELRACRLTVVPDTAHAPGRTPLPLTLLEVWEPQPPAGGEALHWLLWTTERVRDLAAALQVVAWYKLRWRIEDVHLAMKSGYHVEELQFETAERLMKLITLYTPLAVRIVTMRDAARQQPEAPCTEVLTKDEWRTLWATINKQLPAATQCPPTLRQAVLWIGQLGGHLGRKGDGLPGIRTLWRGFRDLEKLTRLYQTCNSFG